GRGRTLGSSYDSCKTYVWFLTVIYNYFKFKVMEAGLVEKENVSHETPKSAAGTASTPLARQLESEKRRREKLKAKRMPRPEHTRIITISNQKGGVGKTTTTVNLSTAMARAGMNVLVIDTDPQGNASTALNIPHQQGVPSIY